MRWLRFLLLGLASVYPLYWTTQFLLFFLPETLVGFWLGEPVRVVAISYLQATAVGHAHAFLPAQWEALTMALFVSALIIGVGADGFLAGCFAVAIFGQVSLVPFFGLIFLGAGPLAYLGAAVALAL